MSTLFYAKIKRYEGILRYASANTCPLCLNDDLHHRRIKTKENKTKKQRIQRKLLQKQIRIPLDRSKSHFKALSPISLGLPLLLHSKPFKSRLNAK